MLTFERPCRKWNIHENTLFPHSMKINIKQYSLYISYMYDTFLSLKIAWKNYVVFITNFDQVLTYIFLVNKLFKEEVCLIKCFELKNIVMFNHVTVMNKQVCQNLSTTSKFLVQNQFKNFMYNLLLFKIVECFNLVIFEK